MKVIHSCPNINDSLARPPLWTIFDVKACMSKFLPRKLYVQLRTHIMISYSVFVNAAYVVQDSVNFYEVTDTNEWITC